MDAAGSEFLSLVSPPLENPLRLALEALGTKYDVSAIYEYGASRLLEKYNGGGKEVVVDTLQRGQC